MMKKMLLSLMIVLIFVSSVSAQSKVIGLSGSDPFGAWSLVNSKSENAWKIGTVTLDPNDSRSLVLSELKAGEVPCLVNTVPGNWTQLKPRPGVDIYTKEKFGDCTVKIELFLTKGSNSGVYLLGEYEVQVADSFGKPDDKLGQGDMGAIYSAAAPKTNAAAEPGTWQKYEIEFVAPKFDADGNKTANALFKKITLNGKIVQENIEVKAPTGGGITMKEAATGPLMLQGNHGPVAFRNIEISQP
ncbi:MAG: DUF1080 domain-containing protein [Planctomycetaceae bacterium]|jgi:hypothetical protein|nr:DUF1080 domain-containing protein [Planctomycetaceae bacterium]